MTENQRELYKLIGNYERFVLDVDRKLESIEQSLEDGSRTFHELESRIEVLEVKDVLGGPSREEKAGIWTGVGGAIYIFAKIVLSRFGVNLP